MSFGLGSSTGAAAPLLDFVLHERLPQAKVGRKAASGGSCEAQGSRAAQRSAEGARTEARRNIRASGGSGAQWLRRESLVNGVAARKICLCNNTWLRQDLALWPAARHTSVDEFPGQSQCERLRSTGKSAPSKAESASRARAQRELARQQ